VVLLEMALAGLDGFRPRPSTRFVLRFYVSRLLSRAFARAYRNEGVRVSSIEEEKNGTKLDLECPTRFAGVGDETPDETHDPTQFPTHHPRGGSARW
jgi:hypothetical protein